MFTENLRIFLIFPYKFHGQWTMATNLKSSFYSGVLGALKKSSFLIFPLFGIHNGEGCSWRTSPPPKWDFSKTN